MATFWIFWKICQKWVLIRRCFATSFTSDILLMFCVICVTNNTARVNSGYANVFLTIYGPLKCYFFIFGNCWILQKVLWKNHSFYGRFSKFLESPTNLIKFHHLEIFDSIIAAPWIFFAFYTEVHFLCLLYYFSGVLPRQRY